MRKRRTSEPPANAFRVAQENMRPRFVDSSGTVHAEATDAFYAAVAAVFKGTELDDRELTIEGSLAVRDKLPDIKQFYPHGHSAVIYIGDPQAREAMDKLFHAILDAIESAHQSGIKRGKSLLMQLASGSLTTKEFNDCALKKEEE